MINLHELINAPGYGKANDVLRGAGYWHELTNDTERIEWLAENVKRMTRVDFMQSWKFDTCEDDYDADFFRRDIDDAATAMEATT